MAIYLFLRWLFSNYVWRWDLLRTLGVVKIPYLGGEYHGYLWSSHDGHEESHKCQFTITQTWTKIIIGSHREPAARFSQTPSTIGAIASVCASNVGALCARIRVAGISAVAREAKVSRATIKALVNQGTAPPRVDSCKVQSGAGTPWR